MTFHFPVKSAVNNVIYHAKRKGEEIDLNDMCASFQESVVDVLVSKVAKASKDYNVKQILVAGGVAANKGLKRKTI